MTATLQEPGSRTGRPDGTAVLVAPDYAQGSRTRRGERLDHVFAERVDWMRTYGRIDHLAVDAGDVTLTFAELEERANQLARHLLALGARPGARIALLFDQAVHSYVAMLAVLKINAAYVPLDVGFPADRIAYIIEDAKAALVLSLSHVPERVEGLEDFARRVVYVDREAPTISSYSNARLSAVERGNPVEDLAYLIYTSGTTGKPKGVAIEHTSICNFVRVAAEVYGIRQQDRVYQGMTIAFDFSVEEIWVPWVAGATLVPKPAGSSLLGLDLHAFLADRRVTALCCVPTLLATIEDDLPELRFLLVSGEACPQDLITRWHRPDRRFLNVYGPTEATVTATWTELHPDRPVTIGQPLPTYATVILDPENPFHSLPHGEVGEIGIAGVGLATGYLNRKDLTDKAFIPDFLGIAGNPSGRIYRTGDLGRVNAKGEIEYLGRIDLQVKIRGYRIELIEIESVLLQVPGVAAAVVDTFEPVEGQKELVGYYSVRAGTGTLDQNMITAHLREQLPPYMVPAYLEQLDAIPMTAQDKVDRRALPAPTSRRAGGPAGEHVAPATETERVLAAALATTLGLDKVSVDSHFFDDLGASSLLLAGFSARVRKTSALPSLSMREIYQNPTVRKLAAAMGDSVPSDGGAVVVDGPAPTGSVVRGSSVGYAMFGTAQLLIMLGMTFLAGLVMHTWVVFAGSAKLPFVSTPVLPGTDLPAVAERGAAFAVALYLAACVVPIVLKWLLVGRWKSRQTRLWSVGHLRFWFVKSLIRFNPLVLFVGSPLYNLYLRALGAKIGRGATILSRSVPVATDLVTIGAGTIIRRDCSFTGYRAIAGAIQTGRVDIGRDVLVGEMTVLDVDSAIGDGAQLGHTSSLHAGQHVPAGERWHGVPAEPTTTDYRSVAPAAGAGWRRFVYSVAQLVVTLAMAVIVAAVLAGLLTLVPASTDAAAASPLLWLYVAAAASAAFVLAIVGGLIAMMVVPRLLSVFIRPGRSYPLYGFHWVVARAVIAMTNSAFFVRLFGDSATAVGYFKALGVRMSDAVQTGSNFGTELRQDSALLTTIGTGTMISDGLVIMNADFSATSFRMSEVTIGANNFIGNNLVLPADAKIGDNVLLGTKVMVPVDGPIRENVGLLGSPSFEIPRNVGDGTEIDDLRNDPAELRRRMNRKLAHNLRTMFVFVAVRWIQAVVTVLAFAAAASLASRFNVLGYVAATLATVLFRTVFTVLVDRAALGFRSLQPRLVSIYDPYFWVHERTWKLGAGVAFAGTPFRNVIHRMLGVKVGRRVFDDGCYIPERTLVSVGDDAVLNATSVIQCHSLEDGMFKSDRTDVGSGVVIGTAAFVHYGVTIGDGAVIDADSFLMKGETVSPLAVWQGNPATEVRVKVKSAVPAPAAVAPQPVVVALAAVRPAMEQAPARAARAARPAATPQPVSAAPAPVRPMRVPAPVRSAAAPRPVAAPRPANAPRRADAPRPVDAPRPANTPRPANAPRRADAPRPVHAPRPADAPRPVRVPRPVHAPRPAAGRPVDAPRPVNAPRPANAPRPVAAPRPVDAPRPAIAHRPVNAPRPGAAPRPAVGPRPAPASRPAPAPRPAPLAAVRPAENGATVRPLRPATPAVPGQGTVAPIRTAAESRRPYVAGPAGATARPVTSVPSRPGGIPARPAARQIPLTGAAEPTVQLKPASAQANPATTEPIVTARYPLSA